MSYDAERVRKEYCNMVLNRCRSEEGRMAFMQAIDYVGYVGDTHECEQEQLDAMRHFIMRVKEPQMLSKMINMTLAYLAECETKHPIRKTAKHKLLIGQDTVTQENMRDVRYVDMARVTARNDSHYVKRGELRGWSMDYLYTLPLSDLWIKKFCQLCRNETTPFLRPCLCRDVFYCSTECQKLDHALHKDYCQESLRLQQQH